MVSCSGIKLFCKCWDGTKYLLKKVNVRVRLAVLLLKKVKKSFHNTLFLTHTGTPPSIALHYTVLHRCYVFSQTEAPLPAKRLQLALLLHLLYCAGLELNLHYLQGMPVVPFLPHVKLFCSSDIRGKIGDCCPQLDLLHSVAKKKKQIYDMVWPREIQYRASQKVFSQFGS